MKAHYYKGGEQQVRVRMRENEMEVDNAHHTLSLFFSTASAYSHLRAGELAVCYGPQPRKPGLSARPLDHYSIVAIWHQEGVEWSEIPSRVFAFAGVPSTCAFAPRPLGALVVGTEEGTLAVFVS